MDRHRGDRYGGNQESYHYRQSRGPSRFSDAPMNNNHRRSPKNYRGGFSDGGGGGGHHRPFDSPPHQPLGGRVDAGDDGFQSMGPDSGFSSNHHQAPLSGQKRGFPFTSRGGGSPDCFDGSGFAKLFVGSVPRTATEEDIRPLFEEHGHVVEVALIKDKRTGQQQGCCFIKYATSEEAERAIRALHNRQTLPGGVGPIQVRYADGERERLVEYKLFVGSLNRQATEKEVEEIFSPYGRVEDVYLMRDDMKQSRGCGFVKFSHKDMAMAAINALNGMYTMRGCDQPLIVRFADPKRPRAGESRGAPAFGGPGFGPRFQAPGIRPTPDLGDTVGGCLPPSAWHPMNPQNMGPSSNASIRGFGRQLHPISGDGSSTMGGPNGALGVSPDASVPGYSVSSTSASQQGGPNSALGVPSDGSVPGLSVSSTSASQQSFNQPFPQGPFGQQISPLQKSIQSPQSLPLPMRLHPQGQLQTPLQTQTSHASPLQPGQQQIPHSCSQVSVNQAVPSQQLIGMGAHLSLSQPQTSSAAAQNNSININVQPRSMSSLGNQQQLPASGQQQVLQSMQQSPSHLAQLLSQQTQSLQASFQSSQQAFSQLQQQLQLMHPSNQGLMPLQSSQTTKQQWPQSVASTPATTTGSDVSSITSVAPSVPIITQGGASVKCNWTEHTSPDGFKYYYNSVTGESRWEKPEELTKYDQRQQKPSVQQQQTQLHPQVMSTLQIPQTQQLQHQTQLRNQQQPQQSSLSSMYQASGAMGTQSHQDISTQFQGSASSVHDPSRFQQTGQEWWKNKRTGI